MLTKEEITEIETYCAEHKVSRKERLAELGIPEWRFYGAKRKIVAREDEAGGGFLQLMPEGHAPEFFANAKRAKGKKGRTVERNLLSVELRTPTGALMRIQGEISVGMLQGIILAGGGHV